MSAGLLGEIAESVLREAGWKPTGTKNKEGLPGWRSDRGEIRYQQINPDKEKGTTKKQPGAKKLRKQPAPPPRTKQKFLRGPLRKMPSRATIQDAVSKVFKGDIPAPPEDDGRAISFKPIGITNAATVQKKQGRILNKHGLKVNSTEMKEMAGFKTTVGDQMEDPPQREDFGTDEEFDTAKKDWVKAAVRRRNPTKLKADFLANMDKAAYKSEAAFKAAQERIKKMSPNEFNKVFSAIAAAEDEEE